MQNRSNSLQTPRDPLWLRSMIGTHLKKKKRNKKALIPVLSSLSAKKKEERGAKGGRRRGGKASILPPSLSPSLRRRFLVLYLQKPVLSRPSGDPDGRAFHSEKVEIKPARLTSPTKKHVRDIKEEVGGGNKRQSSVGL